MAKVAGGIKSKKRREGFPRKQEREREEIEARLMKYKYQPSQQRRCELKTTCDRRQPTTCADVSCQNHMKLKNAIVIDIVGFDCCQWQTC